MKSIFTVSLYYLFLTVQSFATDWRTKIDEDSMGPRCVVYAASKENIEGIQLQDSRFAYFTILSFQPLMTEFVYKFPAKATPPTNLYVRVGKEQFKLRNKNEYAWLAKEADESKFISLVKTEQYILVTYELNGRSIADIYALDGFLDSISELSKLCSIQS